MAYEPTNWKTGDVVTSAKLNKLEIGVAESAGFLKVTVSTDDQGKVETMDKTWHEIHDALANGEYVSIVDLEPEGYFARQYQIIYTTYSQNIGGDGGHYDVVVRETSFDGSAEEDKIFTCATVNDYPQFHYPDDGE